MKTLLTFTLTPTEPMVTILAGTLIISGVALLITYILLHVARTEREQAIRNAMMWTEEASKLKKELDDMRSERNAIEDELTAAKSNIEWERVKHKQQKESKEHWKAKAEESQADIEQWKALYIEQLNRANRFEELHQRMTKRPRDPKTGRFYSAKPRPTAQEMNEGLAAFDAMMGNAIEQLQGLTVRKLCDEVRENANEEI
jgi:uncharacterized protein (DUF3084 family)